MATKENTAKAESTKKKKEAYATHKSKVLKDIRKKVERARARERSSRKKNIILSKEEAIEVQAKMDAGGWKNFSAFAKSQILDKDERRNYEKALQSGDREKIESLLLTTLNNFLSEARFKDYKYDQYINGLLKISKEAIEEEEQYRLIADYIITLDRKHDEEKAASLAYYPYITDIAEALGLNVDTSDEAYLRSLPDWELDKHYNNWNDTMSPFVEEATRRRMEKGKFPDIDVHGTPEEEWKAKMIDARRQIVQMEHKLKDTREGTKRKTENER